MADIFKPLKKKVNGMVTHLVIMGIIMLILGIMIVYTNFMLRLVMGMITIAIAYIFFYGAYKISSIKDDIEKYFKF